MDGKGDRQSTERQLDAPRGQFLPHPGANNVFSGHYKAT